jgi:GT2 family glycosyltransferase
VVDNQSRDLPLLRYLADLAQSKRARVIKYDQPFNYSAINNLAAREAKGQILGLINNDLEVISPHWLQEMVSHALRPEVGAVGAKLYYPDGKIQHAGVVLGIFGLSEHIHRALGRDDPGYCGRVQLTQDISVVTGACLLLRRELFEQLHGLDEGLPVAFNDVDLCLRLLDLGLRNVFTPYAELYHYESATRGSDDSPSKRQRLRMDIQLMQRRWGARVEEDPFYSPNLTVEGSDCSLAFPPRIQRPWIPFLSLEDR